MSLTWQSKKHLYNVYDVLIALDSNEKGITQYSFICPTKSEAIQCRNNVQNTIVKGILNHKYTTQIINAVDLDNNVFWFCIVTKVI